MKKPPLAPQKASIREVHGIPLLDDYAWLQDKNNQEVLTYLRAENAYALEIMKEEEDLEKRLFEELKGRIKPDDHSAPVQIDDYFYYSRTEAGKDYRIYCRKHLSMDAREEILLDCNHLADGHDYFHLGVFEVSADHQVLAYATDTDGSEQYYLYFKNLQDQTLMVDQLQQIADSAAWAMDGETLFYVVQDESMRPYKVMRHRIGTRPEDDAEVYVEEDERFFVAVSRSKNDAFLLVEIGSKITTEVRTLDAYHPDGDFQVFHKREDHHEYELYPHDDCFYIRTNWQAVNFRLMKAPLQPTNKEAWEEVIAHEEAVKIEGVDEFEKYLAIYERLNGLTQIKVLSLADANTHLISYDDPAYFVYGSSNPNFKTDTLRFNYTSLVRPNTVYDYHIPRKHKTVVKETEIPGGYRHEDYTSERIEATADDGTKIPISLVYKKGLRRNGLNPLYLYAYGAYGLNTEPYFNSNRISLLDRGFIFAMAHIRGGADLGEPWYKAGKLLKKMNTFHDFIACAEHLIAEKYTDTEHLCAMGGSAGGLLMGAVTNLRPDLFEAVVAKVPFVDVLNTMLDPNLPLTVTEYEEWGNPQEKEYFDYIRSYSPYDNVKAQDYPHMLITAGLNDPRVSYWEPAKWTAKLRTYKTDDKLLLLKTNMDAGHGGASGRYEYLKEVAFEYAFLIKVLGIHSHESLNI
jgi:oligopeptidase B